MTTNTDTVTRRQAHKLRILDIITVIAHLKFAFPKGRAARIKQSEIYTVAELLSRRIGEEVSHKRVIFELAWIEHGHKELFEQPTEDENEHG